MTGNLKDVFDGIRAENTLKENTLLYLQREMQKRREARTHNLVKKFTAALASVIIIFLSGRFSHNLYFTPSAYVDVDINPSVELTLNRFDRVIGVYAYNEDGETILTEISLKHKNYNGAIIALLEAINQKGYIQDDGLVSVTLQTNSSGKEAKLLTDIQSGIAEYIAEHHHGMQIDVFSVSSDTQSHARDLNVSPAKYLAIQELIGVDPIATIESCRSHSISEIRQLTQEHAENHHGSDNAENNDVPINNSSSNEAEEDYEASDVGVQGSWQGNGNHGSGHHGGDHE